MKRRVVIILTLLVLISNYIYSRMEIESFKNSEFGLQTMSLRPVYSYLRTLSMNHELTVADLLWLRSIQNFLGRFLSVSETELFHEYLETITNLDPRFKIVYLLGGISLSVFCYNGELSNKLLLKAINRFKDDWHIPFLIGYNYFYELGNYLEGAKYIKLASEVPGAPLWLNFLSARLYSAGGEPETAVEFLRRLYEITEDKKTKELIKIRLISAIVEMHIQKIEKAVKEYRRRFNRIPGSLEEIVKQGFLKEIPREPTGGHYYLDKEGNVKSSNINERFIIHLTPGLKLKSKE